MSDRNKINKYMDLALKLIDENSIDIPIAALVVRGDKIISSAINEREKNNVVTHHAEILAIERANKKLNSWRLNDCELYVTLEPCPMCAWAIINSGIKKVYFGAYDTKYGSFESSLNLKELANSKIEIYGGIKEDECKKVLDNYFRKLRNEKEIR